MYMYMTWYAFHVHVHVHRQTLPHPPPLQLIQNFPPSYHQFTHWPDERTKNWEPPSLIPTTAGPPLSLRILAKATTPAITPNPIPLTEGGGMERERGEREMRTEGGGSLWDQAYHKIFCVFWVRSDLHWQSLALCQLSYTVKTVWSGWHVCTHTCT